MLLPRDVLVALVLHTLDDPGRPYERLAKDTALASSTLQRSVKRLTDAGLLTPDRRVRRADLLEFLTHGVRYAYYASPGPPTRGMPTAHAAPPLNRQLAGGETPVWPDPLGTARGYALEPLDKAAPEAARRNPALYELLALVDAIRVGQARERKLATQELNQRLAPGKGHA